MANDKLQGALDLLILKVLARGPEHGYGITVRVKQFSEEALQVEEGSLYPALHRMEQAGWISAAWKPSENNRRARYYLLTPAGKKQLDRETTEWQRVSAAVNGILKVRPA